MISLAYNICTIRQIIVFLYQFRLLTAISSMYRFYLYAVCSTSWIRFFCIFRHTEIRTILTSQNTSTMSLIIFRHPIGLLVSTSTIVYSVFRRKCTSWTAILLKKLFVKSWKLLVVTSLVCSFTHSIYLLMLLRHSRCWNIWLYTMMSCNVTRKFL